jgi:diguanylate cyclase (GGDEF)-like protein
MRRLALPVDRTIALALGVTAAFVIWVLSGAGSGWERTVFSDCIFPFVVLAAVYQAWKASKNTTVDQGTRRAWRLITAAYLSWCVGDAIWAIYEVGLRQQPFPSLADGGYLLFYPLILAGLLTLPGVARNRADRMKLLIDTGTVVLAGGLFVWYLVVEPTIDKSATTSTLEHVLSLAYPVGDVLLIFGVAWTLLRQPAVRLAAMVALIVGALSFVFADVVFARLALSGNDGGVGAPDILWMIGIASMFVAGRYQATHVGSGTTAIRERVTRVSKLPYVGIVIGYGLLLVVAGKEAHAPLSALIFGCAGITALVTMRQMTAQREYTHLMSQFQALAATDSLTGLHNRRNFFRLADRRLSARQGADDPVAVVMIDVDHFKLINDTYGHRVGDEVLAAVSRSLTDAVRTGDVVARFGGDEFVVLLPGSGSAESSVVAERLRRRAMAVPVETSMGPVPVSLSVGVGTHECGTADIENLLLRADEALYEAKRAGRGRVHVAPAS